MTDEVQIVATALGFDPGWRRTGIGAVHRLADGRIISAGQRLVHTQTAKEKRFERLRVSMDDERRHREFYLAFCAAIEAIKPQVVGVENYTIYNPTEYERLRKVAGQFLAFLGLGQKTAKPAFKTPTEFREIFSRETAFSKLLEQLGSLKEAVDAFKVKRGQGAAAKTYGVLVAVLCACYRYNIPVYVFMPADRTLRIAGKAHATKEEVEAALCRKIPGLQDDVQGRIKAKTHQNHVYDGTAHALLALEEWEKWMGDGLRKS